MPLELALLPVVESAFNPVAYSRSRASGLWQFIPSSGKHYGLEQNWWIDERRDVIEATGAALTYLQYLNNYFGGDWFLAIAAYNGGEGTVSAAVRRNQRSGPADRFLQPAAEGRNTRLRAEAAGHQPHRAQPGRRTGCEFAPIPNVPYFDIVEPGRQVDLGEAADLRWRQPRRHVCVEPRLQPHDDADRRARIGCCCRSSNADQFRKAMLDTATPSSATCVVAVERTAAARAPRREARRDPERRSRAATTCRSAALREANNIDGSTIHPGEIAAHPAVGATATLASLAAPREDIAAQLPESSGRARHQQDEVHVVKSGDTLWGIARRYGVTRRLRSRRRTGSSSSAETPASARASTFPAAGRRVRSADSSRMTYKVRRGDTLSEIADQFNVSVRELMTWNKLRTRHFAARRSTTGTLRRFEPAERRLITWDSWQASGP